MVDLTLLAANPPQSHISSLNLQLLKHADMIKAQNLIQIILQTLTLNDTKSKWKNVLSISFMYLWAC